MIKAPPIIPYFYNRASSVQLNRLQQTFKHFGINSHQALLGESLLRLGQYVNSNSVCRLPSDASGKALYLMYKYYDSLFSEKE